MGDKKKTKRQRMLCNKFTLISHKFKLCIFFAYWKDNSFVLGQHPRTFPCKWDGTWGVAGGVWSLKSEILLWSRGLQEWVTAKHHLTPLLALFGPGRKCRRHFSGRPLCKSPRCPSTPACLTKERASPHIKAFGATLANSGTNLAIVLAKKWGMYP